MVVAAFFEGARAEGGGGRGGGGGGGGREGGGGATIRISVYPSPYSMEAPILKPKTKNPKVRASQAISFNAVEVPEVRKTPLFLVNATSRNTSCSILGTVGLPDQTNANCIRG